MTLYIGIDPGLRGAIAFYQPENDELRIEDIPVHELTVNGKKRLHVDKHRLRDLFRETPSGRAVIEDVHSMPKQGVASSFKFGFVSGCIQQAAVDAGYAVQLVPPNVWKRRFRLTADKDSARALASALLPAHARWWPLKKHDGRAEAALLALYGVKYG